MGTTVTTNHSLIKPDGSEPASNWPTQNGTNMDAVDDLLFERLDPTTAQDDTDIAGISSTLFVAGTPVLGFSFTAPPKGKIWVTISGHVQTSLDGHWTELGWAIRSGGTVGSGTDFLTAGNFRTIRVGDSVNAGSPTQLSAGNRRPVSGLTPGAIYNIRAEFRTSSGGNGTINDRFLGVEYVV